MLTFVFSQKKKKGEILQFQLFIYIFTIKLQRQCLWTTQSIANYSLRFWGCMILEACSYQDALLNYEKPWNEVLQEMKTTQKKYVFKNKKQETRSINNTPFLVSLYYSVTWTEMNNLVLIGLFLLILVQSHLCVQQLEHIDVNLRWDMDSLKQFDVRVHLGWEKVCADCNCVLVHQ